MPYDFRTLLKIISGQVLGFPHFKVDLFYHRSCGFKHYDNIIYYKDTIVLLENTPLVKFIRNYVRDSSGVFSISSLVRISMISLLLSLSLKLFFNSLVHDRNTFGSPRKPSAIFGNLRTSSEIFGRFRKMSSNVRVTFRQVFENLRKVVENLRKIFKNAVIRISI